MSWTRPPPPTREERIEARQAPRPRPTVQSLHRGVYEGGVSKPEKALPAKIERKKRQSIRDSANGERCEVRIPGACWGDVIWSHYRGGAGDKGLGTKAFDLCGAYACLGCDAVYDGQRPLPAGITREQVDAAWHEGHLRSLVRLGEKGLV